MNTLIFTEAYRGTISATYETFVSALVDDIWQQRRKPSEEVLRGLLPSIAGLKCGIDLEDGGNEVILAVAIAWPGGETEVLIARRTSGSASGKRMWRNGTQFYPTALKHPTRSMLGKGMKVDSLNN